MYKITIHDDLLPYGVSADDVEMAITVQAVGWPVEACQETVRLEAKAAKWEKRARLLLEGVRHFRADATLQMIAQTMAGAKMHKARAELADLRQHNKTLAAQVTQREERIAHLENLLAIVAKERDEIEEARLALLPFTDEAESDQGDAVFKPDVYCSMCKVSETELGQTIRRFRDIHICFKCYDTMPRHMQEQLQAEHNETFAK
jgi:hypothetical protein